MVASTPSTNHAVDADLELDVRDDARPGSPLRRVDAPPQGRERDRPVHRPVSRYSSPSRAAKALATVDFPEPAGRRWRSPSWRADHSADPAPQLVEEAPEAGEGLGHAAGVGDLDARTAARAGRSSSPCGGRRRSRRWRAQRSRGGRRQPSSASSASTPSRARSSATTAPTRSVSLPRMKPMPRIGSARRRTRRPPPASGRVSEMAFMSTSTPRSAARPTR